MDMAERRLREHGAHDVQQDAVPVGNRILQRVAGPIPVIDVRREVRHIRLLRGGDILPRGGPSRGGVLELLQALDGQQDRKGDREGNVNLLDHFASPFFSFSSSFCPFSSSFLLCTRAFSRKAH